jgi:SAM-dependent methyltransferase
VATWRNAAGHALSASHWLAAHHRAKLPERKRFVESLVEYRPKRVVDLGCASGLWLDLLDGVLPSDCEFIGLDNDTKALELARERAESWDRASTFLQCDIDTDYSKIPDGDLMLAFNIFGYLSSPGELLEHLHREGQTDRTVVRQYDGATLRIGPVHPRDRFVIDLSLQASLQASAQFSHYDLDRTHEVLHRSGLSIERLHFELTERHAPFPEEFVEYFNGTVDWMRMHLSDDARFRLDRALEAMGEERRYFVEVDLIAVVSSLR